MSWFIDGGMRSGIPDAAVRAATITVYTDKPGFLTALGLEDDEEVHIFLLAADGTILWRAAGALSAAAEAELREAVAE